VRKIDNKPALNTRKYVPRLVARLKSDENLWENWDKMKRIAMHEYLERRLCGNSGAKASALPYI
jgi:hypothetical protein